jgi:CubicO group peptidase (beta-lactamase class C family)
MLLNASGIALALPCTARAIGIEASRPAAGPACTFAAATLRRGALIGPSDDESCRTSVGTTAIFQAASLAKPVVASLALRLVLRGLLDLDQPLSELLPDGYVHRQNLFALREPPVVDQVPRQMLQKVTARTLLSHTSGLPNWSSTGPLQLSFEPGTRWQYSGEGFVLLQHVLHALTGKPLQEFASVELFQPFGLRHSAFKVTDRIAQSLVPGQSASGAIRQLRFPFEIASSSLYTSAGDYALFMSSLLADERLLSLATHAPVPVPKAPNVFWGLGWGIEHASERSYIWHWGNNPGFRALAMADLNTKDAVVALAATDKGMPLAKSRVRETLPGPHPGLELSLVQ